MRIHIWLLSIFVIVTVTGCASYVTPRGGANLEAITSRPAQESFAAKPAAQFPASIAAVRVQGSRYCNYHTLQDGGVYGDGRFSIVTVKEVEDDADFARIEKLPQVGGLISISRLLLPPQLNSDADIRDGAARLKADMVLLYTFDTSFRDESKSVGLQVVSLGFSKSQRVSVQVTASALLIDTRTGFVYAAFETNEKRELPSNTWQTADTADQARRDAEKAAFKSLVSEFEKGWPKVIERAKQGA